MGLSYGLISLIDLLFEVLSWLIIGRCILSFVPHNPHQPIIKFVYEITEPIMAPFRRLLPAAGGIDFSPLIALLVLMMVKSLVIRILVVLM